MLSGNDSFLESLFYRQIRETGGDWSQQLYFTGVYGGVGFHDTYGTPFFYRLFAWLNLPPLWAYNLTHFLLQLFFAFLSFRAARDVASLWRGRRVEEAPRIQNSLIEISSLLLLAFAPYLGWRLGYGHQIHLFGALTCAALAALFAMARSGNFTFTTTLLVFIALYNAFTSTGIQMVFYSCFFGFFPLLAILGFPRKGWRKEWARSSIFSALLLASAAAIALRSAWSTIDFYLERNPARAVTGTPIIYSYMTSIWQDWARNFLWAKEIYFEPRDEFLWHEIDYAYGPVLLLLALVPWRRQWGLALGVATMIFFALVISMNIEPLSSGLAEIIPPIASFRVPSRAGMPMATLFLIFALAGIFHAVDHGPSKPPRDPKKTAQKWVIPVHLFCLALVPVVFLSDSWVREILVWLVAAAIVLAIKRAPQFMGLLLLILAAASLSAFRERLLPFVPKHHVETLPESLGRFLVEQEPRLKDPFYRATFEQWLRGFTLSTGFATRVSTLDGNWIPPRRFLQLEAALRHREAHPATVYWSFQPDHEGYETLRNLFNVSFIVRTTTQPPKVESLGPTMGPAWFSDGVEEVGSYKELVEFIKPGSNLHRRLKHRAFYVVEGEKDRPQWPAFSANCSLSQVVDAKGFLVGEKVAEVSVQSVGLCPISFSLGFSSHLRALLVRENHSTDQVQLFPVYGALTGAVIPQGKHKIILEAPAILPVWVKATSVIGWLSFVSLVLFIWRQRGNCL